MFKTTRTKSGMLIVTVKAFGFFANISLGLSAAKPVKVAKPEGRYEWHHSYEQSCAASDYATLQTAKEFGYSRVNVCEASQKMWMACRNEYLARQPKLTRYFVTA